MAEQWSAYVNTKFYGQDGGYNDNAETLEFKSGRTIKYMKNSAPKKTHAVNLRCNDRDADRTDGKTEFGWFLDWYENTVKSGTVPFRLADIATGTGTKEYMLKEAPTWTGQGFKEVSMTLEEV